MNLSAQGITIPTIAERLGVTERTVDRYIEHQIGKIELEGRWAPTRVKILRLEALQELFYAWNNRARKLAVEMTQSDDPKKAEQAGHALEQLLKLIGRESRLSGVDQITKIVGDPSQPVSIENAASTRQLTGIILAALNNYPDAQEAARAALENANDT